MESVRDVTVRSEGGMVRYTDEFLNSAVDYSHYVDWAEWYEILSRADARFPVAMVYPGLPLQVNRPAVPAS